jgi:hypothetical protein
MFSHIHGDGYIAGWFLGLPDIHLKLDKSILPLHGRSVKAAIFESSRI